MSSKQNIICISNTAWDTDFLQSTKQLVALIALDHRMLYVDYPYTIKDVFECLIGKKKIDVKRILGITSRVRTDVTEYNSQVYVLSLPPILPVNWIDNTTLYSLFNWFNKRLINGCVIRNQKKLHFENPIVINAWNPVLGMGMLGKLKEKLLVYYCYDEISAGQWVKKHGQFYEEGFLKKVSCVVVTSKELQKNKSRFNPRCFLVRNGVDFPLYQNFHQGSYPEITNGFPECSNIVGYVGTIDDRLDQPMLSYVMEHMPETLFVFIGRVTHMKVKEQLSLSKNSHFIDPMSASELPKHIRYFSAGIIPFVKNKFTQNIYPMKINEYLAMGKPVVLTEFSDLDEFKGMCSFANTREEFVQALNAEMLSDNQEKIDKRIQVASQNSWQNRAREFIDIIEKLSSGN